MATVETLKLTVQQMQCLRRILKHYMPDEKRHYEESGEPFDHVWHDLYEVQWAIREHDHNTSRKELPDELLTENITRLSQG